MTRPGSNEFKAHEPFMKMRAKVIASEKDKADTALGHAGTRRRTSKEVAEQTREEATQVVKAIEEDGYEDLDDYKFIDEKFWDEKKHDEKPLPKTRQQKYCMEFGEVCWGYWTKMGAEGESIRRFKKSNITRTERHMADNRGPLGQEQVDNARAAAKEYNKKQATQVKSSAVKVSEPTSADIWEALQLLTRPASSRGDGHRHQLQDTKTDVADSDKGNETREDFDDADAVCEDNSAGASQSIESFFGIIEPSAAPSASSASSSNSSKTPKPDPAVTRLAPSTGHPHATNTSKSTGQALASNTFKPTGQAQAGHTFTHTGPAPAPQMSKKSETPSHNKHKELHHDGRQEKFKQTLQACITGENAAALQKVKQLDVDKCSSKEEIKKALEGAKKTLRSARANLDSMRYRGDKVTDATKEHCADSLATLDNMLAATNAAMSLINVWLKEPIATQEWLDSIAQCEKLDGFFFTMLDTMVVKKITFEHRAKLYLVQGKHQDLFELASVQPTWGCPEREKWRVVALVNEMMTVITHIHVNDSTLVQEPSDALSKARRLMKELAELPLRLAATAPGACKPENLLVPETTDAARKWDALLNYREAAIPTVNDVLLWCDRHEKDTSSISSIMAQSLVKQKSAKAFAASARAYLDTVKDCATLESNVAVVEENAKSIQARPLVTTILIFGDVRNEWTSFILDYIIPFEACTKSAKGSFDELKEKVAKSPGLEKQIGTRMKRSKVRLDNAIDTAYAAATDHWCTWTHAALCQVMFAAYCGVEGDGMVEVNGEDKAFDMSIVSDLLFDTTALCYIAADEVQTPLGYKLNSGQAHATNVTLSQFEHERRSQFCWKQKEFLRICIPLYDAIALAMPNGL